MIRPDGTIRADEVIQRGPILSVQYWMDGDFKGDWNTELRSSYEQPFHTLPERALDDAVAAANMMRDFGPISRLQDMRTERAAAIDHHFRQTAHKLIQQIEEREGWKYWLGRLGKT